METRNESRLWTVVAVTLLASAVVVLIATFTLDTAEQDSIKWNLLTTLLTLGGTGAVYMSRRGRSEDRPR